MIHDVKDNLSSKNIQSRKYSLQEGTHKSVLAAAPINTNRYTLEQDSKGWALTKTGNEEMVNTLLEERGGKPVGKNCIDNFVNCTPELRTQRSHSYNR